MPRNELDLALRAVELADGPLQATVTRDRLLAASCQGSRPRPADEADQTVVEVLAWHGGQTARAAASGTGDEALREAVRRAEAEARAAAADGTGDHPGLPEPAPAGAPHQGFDAATAALDPAAAAAALDAVIAVAAQRGVEASATWTARDVTTAIASTTGIAVRDRVTAARLEVVCSSGAGRTGYAEQTASAASAIDAAAVARHAAAKLLPGEPREIEPGVHPVVLEAPAVGSLLTVLAGLAFDGLAHAEGRGALSGRLGTRVVAPHVAQADTTRLAGTLPRAFDAEGQPKKPLPLIQDGVAHRVAHDTRSAAKAGAVSTGHAVPGADGPRPTNLYMIGGGAAGEAELIAGVEHGVYVTRLRDVQVVDARGTTVTGATADGTFLIEDGRIAGPLRDVTFSDSVLSVLSHVQALTSRTRLAGGAVCPSLRAAGLRVTG